VVSDFYGAVAYGWHILSDKIMKVIILIKFFFKEYYVNYILLLSASKPAFSTTSTYTATTRQVTQATPKATSYSSAYTTPGTQATNYSTGYTAAAAQTTNANKGMCH
jgi:hypothetical protein